MASAKERFWSKVKIAGKSDCWEWTGAKKEKGYGNLTIDGHCRIAHRVAWEFTYGEIPQGMQIQHSCDNPSCCNPNHLMLGTVVSNYIDMVRKGRGRSDHKNRRYGTNNHNAKLTFDQVEEIRKAYVPGQIKQADLAKQYGVSQRLISIITRNEGRIHG